MSDMILQAEHLVKTYGSGEGCVHALRDVSLSVEKGSFTAIMGKSGCGKSTLLQALGGLDTPDSGSVRLEGTELYQLSDEKLAQIRRRRIGFVFQAFHLLPEYTIRDNILLPTFLDGATPDMDYFSELVKTLEIEPLLQKQPTQLSGGQQQRAAIARALLRRPAIILADEPTGNLDSQNAAAVFSLLRQTTLKNGQTVIYVTHDAELGRQADRVLTMQDGMIL